jgi:hypothetical protein
VWPVLRFNHVVIAVNGADPGRVSTAGGPGGPPVVLRELLEDGLGPAVRPAGDPWTDDHAPVEWVTDRMIVEYAARGGGLDEELLPTAPE